MSRFLITVLLACSSVFAAAAADIPQDPAAVMRESTRLVAMMQGQGMDAAIDAIIDLPNFITMDRESDKSVLISNFGDGSPVATCFGGLSKRAAEHVGTLTSGDGYIKQVFFLNYTFGKIPVVLIWTRGDRGYYLVGIKMSGMAEGELNALLTPTVEPKMDEKK
ncbi:MAG: hypothetical protein H0W83_04020 [Planctomycetes bacterium]|nr:hypothetical protein [Planctomycetota bacterium]